MTKTNCLSLNMRKYIKLLNAVIRKNKSERPFDLYTLEDLFKVFERERLEFNVAITNIINHKSPLVSWGYDEKGDKCINLLDEIADLSNILDFIYERVIQELFNENGDI